MGKYNIITIRISIKTMYIYFIIKVTIHINTDVTYMKYLLNKYILKQYQINIYSFIKINENIDYIYYHYGKLSN